MPRSVPRPERAARRPLTSLTSLNHHCHRRTTGDLVTPSRNAIVYLPATATDSHIEHNLHSTVGGPGQTTGLVRPLIGMQSHLQSAGRTAPCCVGGKAPQGIPHRSVPAAVTLSECVEQPQSCRAKVSLCVSVHGLEVQYLQFKPTSDCQECPGLVVHILHPPTSTSFRHPSFSLSTLPILFSQPNKVKDGF